MAAFENIFWEKTTTLIYGLFMAVVVRFQTYILSNQYLTYIPIYSKVSGHSPLDNCSPVTDQLIQLPPMKFPPGQLLSGLLPPRQLPNLFPLDNCPPVNCPPRNFPQDNYSPKFCPQDNYP